MALHRTFKDNFDCHNLAENVTGLKAIVCVYGCTDRWACACMRALCVYVCVCECVHICLCLCMYVYACLWCVCMCVNT